jgi:hypothetical protein
MSKTVGDVNAGSRLTMSGCSAVLVVLTAKELRGNLHFF